MNRKHHLRNLCLIVLLTIFLGLTVNPWKLPKLEINIPVIASIWNWMQQTTVKLGLDLQGGTQLDYEIDLRDARGRNSDEDSSNDVNISALLSGVKDVIEKRVNSLGVAEPNIYLSSAGEEEHIIVELPGVKDIQQAKDRVGKVVQLEFKTELEKPSEGDIKAVELKAKNFLKKVRAEKSVPDLEEYIEDLKIPNQVEYKKQEKAYFDEIPESFRSVVQKLTLNTFHTEALKTKESQYLFVEGRAQLPEGFNILRVKEKESQLRKKPKNAQDFLVVMKDFGLKPSDEYVREEALPEDLKREIAAIGVEEVSEVLEGRDAFVIAKMEEKMGPENDPRIRTSHILFKTEDKKEPKDIQPYKTVDEKSTTVEKKRAERENKKIEEENKKIEEENVKISAENEQIEKRNQAKKALAEKVLAEVIAHPEQFSELAKRYSEDESNKAKGGDLGYAAPQTYVDEYKNAALALEKGTITDELVKTLFGYHIIQLVDTKEKDESLYKLQIIRIPFGTSKEEAQKKADETLKRVRSETVYTFERVWFNALPDPWKKTELDARYFKRADVAYDPISSRPYVAVSFNDEGAKLFEKITEENVKKRIGIFVGGEFISAPVVQEKISGGNAQITLGTANIQLALKEANDLASSLNAGSIPAPLKKPNELNIGASLGEEALQTSIYAGIVGLLAVCVFMILYYRFLGILASIALFIYGLFLMFLIGSEISPPIALLISFGLWVSFAFTLIKSNIDLLGKTIFMGLSIFGALFVYSVLVNPIVLTLAGIAGLILSIGMAVDANILIFERMKEEFAQGKSFLVVVEEGFERAWSSILDSNVSSLITCAILFFFGTSIIKGFAINLATGIVVSMFTAITVTRTLILLFEGTRLEKLSWIWKRK